MERLIHTMPDEELLSLLQCHQENRWDDLPPLFDPRTLTDEEREASVALHHAKRQAKQ